MKHYGFLPIVVGLLLSLPTTFFAQQMGTTDVPRVISYQGLVASSDGTPLPDGVHTIKVTLYADAAGAQVIWKDSYDATTVNGVFNLLLGNGATPLPENAGMNRPLWIGTQVNDHEEMRPLTPLTASPYALTVPDHAITSEKIADGAVTEKQIGMPYVSRILVNGDDVTGRGTIFNIETGSDSPVNYSNDTVTLHLDQASAKAQTDQEKGSQILVGGDNVWSFGGDGWDVGGATGVAPGASDWIGTKGNLNFELRTYNTIAMRYQPNGSATPSIIGGHVNNSISNSTGSVIAGGGASTTAHSIDGSYDFIGGGTKNTIQEGNDHSAIVGGYDNTIYNGTSTLNDDSYNFIGGGHDNEISSTSITGTSSSSILGGELNTILGDLSTIGGGQNNMIEDDAYASTIGGGNDNTTTGYYAAIGGGHANIAGGALTEVQFRPAVVAGGGRNKASGFSSAVVGGLENHASGEGSFIGGGGSDYVHSLGTYTSVASGNYSAIVGGFTQTVSGDYSFIGSGDNIVVQGDWSAISGGDENKVNNASSNYGTIGGGQTNEVGTVSTASSWATISGGKTNKATADYTSIGGGTLNDAKASYATISGGNDNDVDAASSAIGGGATNKIIDAGSTYSTVGGGQSNEIGVAATPAQWSTISGGYSNVVKANYGALGGGNDNTIESEGSAVGGGETNKVLNSGSTHGSIGGGEGNEIGAAGTPAAWAFIGGGSANIVSADFSVNSGGYLNRIGSAGEASFIGGGGANVADGPGCVVAGGVVNFILNSTSSWNAIGGGNGNRIGTDLNAASYSTIGGGQSNLVRTDHSTVGGGYANQINNSSHATIPGGLNLRAQSFGQIVSGFYNSPQGSIASAPTVTQTNAFNDRLFIIGNGTSGLRHNAFEVSYNGHSIVYDKNGTGATRAAVRGATYMDNVVYAWATAELNMESVTVTCDFGVSSIQRMAPGSYRVNLNLMEPDGTTPLQLSCGSVTATIQSAGPECMFITTTPINWDGVAGVNWFQVFITTPVFDPIEQEIDCVGFDQNFTFKVTGRPSSN